MFREITHPSVIDLKEEFRNGRRQKLFDVGRVLCIPRGLVDILLTLASFFCPPTVSTASTVVTGRLAADNTTCAVTITCQNASSQTAFADPDTVAVLGLAFTNGALMVDHLGV